MVANKTEIGQSCEFRLFKLYRWILKFGFRGLRFSTFTESTHGPEVFHRIADINIFVNTQDAKNFV